jgi:pilus assembly protein Flp/PilA
MLSLYTFIQSWVTARTADSERGATMVEYGLLLVFIALVVAVAAATLGDDVSDLFTDTSTEIKKRPGG